MKLLILNSKSFGYKLHHKTPVAEEVDENKLQNDFKNPLVIFIAIEEKDEENIIEKVGNDIYRIAIQNKSSIILLNPFAHLASSLAKPSKAIELLEKLNKNLQQHSEFETERLTFGWYEEFSIDVSGENNSQIFREY